MLPNFARADLANQTSGNAEVSGYLYTVSFGFVYFLNFFRRKFRGMVTFAHWTQFRATYQNICFAIVNGGRRMATLRDAIVRIIFGCSTEQMGRVYTGRRVTFMEHRKPGRNWACVAPVRKSVREYVSFTRQTKHSVARFIFRTLPQPAHFSFYYVRIKAALDAAKLAPMVQPGGNRERFVTVQTVFLHVGPLKTCYQR